MEWVETTAKTLDEAKDLALDRLGVAADEAEFEILEEPRAGLFGRLRGEARVRARVMPTAVRPKQDRRRGRNKSEARGGKGRGKGQAANTDNDAPDGASEPVAAPDGRDDGAPNDGTRPDAGRNDGRTNDESSRPKSSRSRRSNSSKQQQKEQQVNTDDARESDVSPDEVGAAAEAFVAGLAAAIGATAETSVEIDGSDIDVRMTGSELGLLVGHGGRTLLAIQDLARVASQRRLGDHDTRLRIDIGGYREKRRVALEKFAIAVANQVVESGQPKALEPMQSADRKIVHDALASVEGVSSRSEGDDPMRRVVISPA